MATFRVTTISGEEKMVEADAYSDSQNGRWIDFVRTAQAGTGYSAPVQVQRLRAEDVQEIRLVEG